MYTFLRIFVNCIGVCVANRNSLRSKNKNLKRRWGDNKTKIGDLTRGRQSGGHLMASDQNNQHAFFMCVVCVVFVVLFCVFVLG